MALVEDDAGLKAPLYKRPLNYTYDRSLNGGGGWRFVFEQGSIRCSKPLSPYADVCRIAPNELNSLGSPDLTFVYLDAGRWGGTEYSFGLGAGNDVYLCEYVPGEDWSDDQVPQCRNPQISNLIAQLWALNCGVRVLQYAHASAPTHGDSTDIHILIPDFHMPPVSWYFTREAATVFDPAYYRAPPDWFCQTPAYRRNHNLYNAWYGMKTIRTGGPVNDADIFGNAGKHLVRFLNALCRTSDSIRNKLHVVNMGDMTELWLNRAYQFVPGKDLQPDFIPGGVDNVADWVSEVVLWNMEVIEAQRALDQAGFSSVTYLWGNHDAYLMSPDVCSQVSFHRREGSFIGSGGKLHVEHGHRFDSSNFDNIKSSDGPFFANAAYYFPAIRKAEPLGRGAVSLVSGAPEERDCYLIGASLLFLQQKFVETKSPFRVFCMGHTHSRMLRTFNISGQYSLWGNVQ
jgi:hypothetical protein